MHLIGLEVLAEINNQHLKSSPRQLIELPVSGEYTVDFIVEYILKVQQNNIVKDFVSEIPIMIISSSVSRLVIHK